MIALLQESYDKSSQCVAKQSHHSARLYTDKGPYSQGYGFPSNHIQVLELDTKEGPAPKNWCLWTVCRRLLRVPWTARRSNQSILKEINPEYSLEGLMLKLKLQYFGHLMWIANSLEKSLMLVKIEGRRRRGYQRMRWLDGIIDTMDKNLGKPGDGEAWRSLACCSPWDHKSQTQLDTTVYIYIYIYTHIHSYVYSTRDGQPNIYKVQTD